MPACVLPVSARDAERWALGLASDTELLLSASLVPEAIFIVGLPDLASYRQALRDVARLWKAGARMIITRTHNDAVFHHLDKNGCKVTAFDGPGYLGPCRFIAGPVELEKWIGKFTKKNG